jgi:hypothetical protein
MDNDAITKAIRAASEVAARPAHDDHLAIDRVILVRGFLAAMERIAAYETTIRTDNGAVIAGLKEELNSLNAKYALILDEHKFQAEELRRAQLLTPETVKAVCEREGFERVDSGTGFARYRNAAKHEIVGYSDDTVSYGGKRYQTVGQLEDAIAECRKDVANG